MAQFERVRRPSDSPKTPLSQPNSPNFEQLLKGEDMKGSPRTTSPTFGINSIDQRECFSPPRKSVFAKMKERARKLRHSLGGRRRIESGISSGHSMHESWAPSVTFDSRSIEEDDDDYEHEGDPEYLGAPMYESETAPKSLKETARQHPRAEPVISENHRMPTYTKTKEPAPQNDEPLCLNATMTEAQVPAYSTTSNGTDQIVCPRNEKQHEASSSQRWDKGISVKEYFLNKLEPGEDERALSQAITEAISPRRSSTGEARMVEKVKGAVTSFLWHQQEPSKTTCETAASSSSASSNNPTHNLPNSANANPSEIHYSASDRYSSPQNGTEEENQGKILQAN